MPRVLTLRDCFVYDRYHEKGREYNLPAGVVISPKNFTLLDVPEVAPGAPVSVEAPLQPTPEPIIVKAQRKLRKAKRATRASK